MPELMLHLPEVSELPAVRASSLEILMRKISEMPEPPKFNFIIVWPSTYWIFAKLGLPLSQNKYVDAPSLSDKSLVSLFDSVFSSFVLKFVELKPLFCCQFMQDGTLSVPRNIVGQANRYFNSKLCFFNYVFTLPTSQCAEMQHYHHTSLLCSSDFRNVIANFRSSLESDNLLSSDTLLSHTVLKDESHFLLYEESTPTEKPKKATSPFIQCSIEGYPCSALADTGSEITLISSVFFDQLSEATGHWC